MKFKSLILFFCYQFYGMKKLPNRMSRLVETWFSLTFVETSILRDQYYFQCI